MFLNSSALRKNLPTYLEGEKKNEYCSSVHHLTISSIQHSKHEWCKSLLISSTSMDSPIGWLFADDIQICQDFSDFFS